MQEIKPLNIIDQKNYLYWQNKIIMYIKEFDIRWSDIDANKHLGNSSYIDYMSHVRMSFFDENKMGLKEMTNLGLGPIVFYEHIYYFKEILLEDNIKVSLEIAGYSDDCKFVMFSHNFYDDKGKHLAHCEMLFSWIDLNTRKLAQVPSELAEKIKRFPKGKNFKTLTKEDTRKHGKRPIDLV